VDESVKRSTYDVDEAARILGIGRSAAYEAVRRGEIPSIRLGMARKSEECATFAMAIIGGIGLPGHNLVRRTTDRAPTHGRVAQKQGLRRAVRNSFNLFSMATEGREVFS
jgi:excisionase family DNA binding protein